MTGDKGSWHSDHRVVKGQDMSVLVALTGWDIPHWVERFQRLLPNRTIVALGDSYDPASIHYAVSWKHPAGSLQNLPNLRAIFSLGAGVDHLMNDPLLPDVPVARVVDADLTARMSEYVVMHCLMVLRQQRRYQQQQVQKLWLDDRDQPAAQDLRVGVMGLGVLGRDAIHKLQVMGFQLAGWSRSPHQIDGVQCFHGEAGLSEFLAQTDILVVLLPLTPDTKGLIDAKLLRQLAHDGPLGKPVLINAGRGGLQKEADILACLDDGSLGEAILDVFETEPLPDASKLWSHPKVVVTPHNAAMSAPDAIGQLVARQIARFEQGQSLLHQVEMKRGY
jgi:glyoxylate/hydroxypyruvate reductase A